MNDRPDIPGYELRRELGHGGMATVYLAHQQSLDREVAIKVMAAALNADREFSARFLAEARTAARLSHPGIVGVHDMGVAGHHHYIAMEYIAGGDLKDRLRQGAIEPSEAASLLRQIASALAYAHEEGFVHRDVKPENILFRKNGHPVLSDFGIARAIGSGTRMTATGLSIGTPHYMSPEQARGQAVDGRSDLYALGVAFFEMLTGQVPFDAQDSFAVGLQHINDPVPQLPVALASYQPLIDHLLAKDPADRYQTGAELIEDLDHMEQGEKLKPARSVTRVVKGVGQGARLKAQDASTREQGGEASRDSRSGLYWGLTGAILAAVLAVGIYAWQDQRSSTPPIGGGTTTVSRPAPQPIATVDTESATPEPGARNPETAPTGTAILHITTTPEGAEVFLNDHPLGQTPFQSDELPEGEHRLRLVHRYYEPWEQTVRLEDDVVERIEPELQRGTGRVTVVTDPPGAEVRVDGELAEGTTPLTVSDLRSGDQPLEIRLARYRTKTHEVEILPGETARLDIALEGGELYEWEGQWLTADEIIPMLLDAAKIDLNATRLMQPEGNNAWDKYQKVLRLQAGNQEAREGVRKIGERYLALASTSVAEGQSERARLFIANARLTGVSSEATYFIESFLAKDQIGHAATFLELAESSLSMHPSFNDAREAIKEQAIVRHKDDIQSELDRSNYSGALAIAQNLQELNHGAARKQRKKISQLKYEHLTRQFQDALAIRNFQYARELHQRMKDLDPARITDEFSMSHIEALESAQNIEFIRSAISSGDLNRARRRMGTIREGTLEEEAIDELRDKIDRLAAAQLHPFVDNGDGTFTDARYGLQWYRCPLGERWDGSTCQSRESRHHFRFRDARRTVRQNNGEEGVAGYIDWQLPTRRQVESFFSCDHQSISNTANCVGGELTQDFIQRLFPSVGVGRFWTSSTHMTLVTHVTNQDLGWAYSMNRRELSHSDRLSRLPVLLVRETQ